MTPPQAALPLFDLRRGWAELRDDAISAFDRLGRNGAFTLGAELAEFEADFADFCGARHAVGVANGTVAIELALRAVGAGPGTEVVTVSHTFVATVEAISATGATPVLVDVEPRTRTLDPELLRAALNERTAAVVPVHLYGRPAAMPQILSICAEAGVPVIEDCAQAHGALLGGARVGALGAAGAFSFYPTKNLGAMGDGGAVVTDDPEVAAVVTALRHHGSAPSDANRHELVGGTERLDNLQAAFLALKLRKLEADNAARGWAAGRLRGLLAGLPLTLPPADTDGVTSVHHLFVVELDERDRVRAALHADGVGTGVHYPTPVHLQPAWRGLGYAAGDLPASERLANRVLSLPAFPGIKEHELERVAASLAAALT